MRRYLAIIVLLAVICSSHATPKRYASPYVISENQELPRSNFVSYLNADDAFRNDFDSSQYYVELNGEWDFKLFSSANAIPAEVKGDGAVLKSLTEKWQQVSLPGAWELSEHGSTGDAVFASKAYDFAKSAQDVNPPKLPAASPVGVYVRHFAVPFNLFDKAHFLHIGAVKAGVKVYVNGNEVGFSKRDSKNPAEFDVSKYVSEGRNWVALVVPQFTEASYVEDWQDWRLSGINRDIFLFAQPKIRIRDYTVQTTLDPTYTNGLLETAMLLKTQLLNSADVTVYYDLYDPQGKLVNKYTREMNIGMRTEDTVRFTTSVPNVVKWTAESPALYTILYRIKREGRFTEQVACRVGFRTVEIRADKFLVNGQPLIFKGVNIAEHMPTTGNAVDTSQMRDMLTEMKQAGVNAIRTDGYPMPDSFYRLSDELGFYVCDVANINTWGLGTSRYKGANISNNPAWRDVYLARINAMYERNKNHPSVVMWALGDRSGNGYNMYQGYLMLKAKEQTRPVVYNGAAMEWNTDVYCPDYPEKALYNGSGRPFIPSRVVFNPAYWTTLGLQGAFLERWNDMSLSTSAVDGVRMYNLTDNYQLNTLPNGVVDLVSMSKNEQLRTIFANVEITQVDVSKGIYRFKNKLQFTDLDRFTVSYSLSASDNIIRKGIVNVAAEPGKTVDVHIPNVGSVAKGRKLTIKVGNICKTVF